MPEVFWFGKESNHFVLVMELLDRNVDAIFVQEAQRKDFTLMTVLLIVDQMVSLGCLDSCGFS